ncbi:MAG: 30S ribosomal protein S13 [Nanoarchaeota archaeon]
MVEPQAQQEPMKHLIRIANTDINGNKPVMYALKKIKGVGINFASAAIRILKLNPVQKIGLMTDAEIKSIEEVVRNPQKFHIPTWLYNRQNDLETGNNMHLLGTELMLAHEGDIKLMKKIKCYKGVRHILGQPVRGQRTRGNFRKNKGKVKLGVYKSAIKKEPKKEDKKK